MKLEDTASELAKIPVAPPKADSIPSLPEFKWTPQDVFCSTLFGPWDDLPCSNYHGQTNLLRDLDRVISLFDARIQHSDEGFRAWRARHKQAMEAGHAEIPGFPALRKMRGGKYVWQDEVWEKRYHYLVHQRHHMILARLHGRFMLTLRERDAFFGLLPAPPRETLQSRARGIYSRPLGLRCDWYRPLDHLLERAAETWNMDKEEVSSQFWREEGPLSSPIEGQEIELGNKEEVEEEEPSAAAEVLGKDRKEKEIKDEPSMGKMDLAFLLNQSPVTPGGRVPHVPLEGQMSC